MAEATPKASEGITSPPPTATPPPHDDKQQERAELLKSVEMFEPSRMVSVTAGHLRNVLGPAAASCGADSTVPDEKLVAVTVQQIRNACGT